MIEDQNQVVLQKVAGLCRVHSKPGNHCLQRLGQQKRRANASRLPDLLLLSPIAREKEIVEKINKTPKNRQHVLYVSGRNTVLDNEKGRLPGCTKPGKNPARWTQK